MFIILIRPIKLMLNTIKVIPATNMATAIITE